MDRACRCAVIDRVLGKVAMFLFILAIFAGAVCYCTDEVFSVDRNRLISRTALDNEAEELQTKEKQDVGAQVNMDDDAGMYFPKWIPKGYTSGG